MHASRYLPPQLALYVPIGAALSAFGATALGACGLALSSQRAVPLPGGRITLLAFLLFGLNLLLVPLTMRIYEILEVGDTQLW